MCKWAICKLIAPTQYTVQTGCLNTGSAYFFVLYAACKRQLKCFLGRQWACSSVQLFLREAIPPTAGGKGLFCLHPAASSCQKNTGAMCRTKRFCLIASGSSERCREYQQHMGLRGFQSFNKHYMHHNKTTVFWYLDQLNK